MNIKLKTKIFISIIILINLICTVVYAAGGNYSAGISLTSNSKLKEGDTVTITVNLNNINAGEGLDSIKAKINYDTNVFEEVTASSFTSVNNWNASYSSAKNNVTFIKSTGTKVTQAEAVGTITLKVKSSINVESTTITFTGITVSGGLPAMGGTGDIKVNDTSITINKEKEPSNPTDPSDDNKNDGNTSIDGNIVDNGNGNTNNGNTNNGNTNGGTNNGNTNSGSKNTKNTIKDNTVTKTSTLPKAGLEQYGIVAIIAVLVVAIVSYILYKRYEKNVK